MTREEAIKHFEAWAQCNYAPTRDAALMALSALRPVSREQVEKVWKGEWIHDGQRIENGIDWYHCSKCLNPIREESIGQLFCAHCGAPMTDEAVQIVMKRLEALYETDL